MKTITHSEAKVKIDLYFKNNWNKIFITFPNEYRISIDHEEYIFIHVDWNGSTDFAGLGNLYKFLWTNEL